MTNSEGQKPKKHNDDLKNTNSKLPWWVEILFVQIGLPEKLLRNILNFKANSSKHLINNKRKYYLVILILASIIYINPLLKQAKQSNNCIEETLNLLANRELDNEYEKSIGKKIMSVNYCNGGSYLLFD